MIWSGREREKDIYDGVSLVYIVNTYLDYHVQQCEYEYTAVRSLPLTGLCRTNSPSTRVCRAGMDGRAMTIEDEMCID